MVAHFLLFRLISLVLLNLPPLLSPGDLVERLLVLHLLVLAESGTVAVCHIAAFELADEPQQLFVDGINMPI